MTEARRRFGDTDIKWRWYYNMNGTRSRRFDRLKFNLSIGPHDGWSSFTLAHSGRIFGEDGHKARKVRRTSIRDALGWMYHRLEFGWMWCAND